MTRFNDGTYRDDSGRFVFKFDQTPIAAMSGTPGRPYCEVTNTSTNQVECIVFAQTDPETWEESALRTAWIAFEEVRRADS